MTIDAVTELWCSMIPPLSRDPQSDLTGRANDHDRVDEVRSRYCETFMGLPGVVSFGMTRLSVWQRRQGTEPAASAPVLDFALSVGVLDDRRLPLEPLFLEGVPLVARAVRLPRRSRPVRRTTQA